MEVGIIGLAKSGKTTIFEALTSGSASSAVPSAAAGTYRAMVKVPDGRLEDLATLFHPEKVTAAEVHYVDFATVPRSRRGPEGIGGQYLTQLSKADALVHVVRAFNDPRVPHTDGSVDPGRDIATMDMELAFSDLSILERRLQRLETSLKGSKPQEREAILQEQQLLGSIKTRLEEDIPIRAQTLNLEQLKLIENFQFLTAKPVIVLLNIGEAGLEQAEAVEREWQERLLYPRTGVAALCGKLEMELGGLSAEDAAQFRSALGSISQAARERAIRLSYELLGLISFFTVGSDEVKAWTVHRDTPAVKAAGKVHSDIERGFIRAEVIDCHDLLACGGLTEARRRGLLRSEGKTYIVQDGDVITFLFHV